MSEAHAPRLPSAEQAESVLDSATRIRDTRTGAESTVADWVSACEAEEGRSRSACLEELMNAIARADVVKL